MRWLAALLLSILFIPIAHPQVIPEPIRLCVAIPQSSSWHIVKPSWQQKELTRALERSNNNEDVKKGTTARVKPVVLRSTSTAELDMKVRNCGFILYTSLAKVQPLGKPQTGLPRPRVWQDATVNYRIMRADSPKWCLSGVASARDTVSEQTLVSRLMEQIASGVASEVRTLHSGGKVNGFSASDCSQ
jgi:hypothetical protein